MKARFSVGDIICLAAALAVLAVSWRFTSPSNTFVGACLASGAAIPILSRVVRRLSKPYRTLVYLPIGIFCAVLIPLPRHHYPSHPILSSCVTIVTFLSALTVGAGIADLSLRLFFPIKRGEERT
jgi:hypothetical protein